MAKMFYTMDETKAALGKTEEEIKQLAREGRLREFRDGPRLMFKADQVEAVKGDSGRDQIDLGPSDSGAPIGLVDSKSASGTSVTLSDTDGRSPAGGVTMKEDTALAADLGMSGSMGGVPSPGRTGASSGSGLSGTAAGSRAGVNVFHGEDVEHADPSAQTAISGTVNDQVNLEGVGSGSGLLDLTRESDDTSLGAELLDEIAPAGGTRAGGTAGGDTGVGMSTGTGMESPIIETRGGARYGTAAQTVEIADPWASAMGGAALAGTIFALVGAFFLICAVVGVKATQLNFLVWDENTKGYRSIWFSFLVGLAAVIVFGIIGLIVGKSAKR